MALMTVTFSEDELLELEQLLDSQIRASLIEAHRADRAEFRKVIEHRIGVLQRLREGVRQSRPVEGVFMGS